MKVPVTVEELLSRGSMDESPELRLLFHRLNNQLGIILAHAELLEAKATDDMNRARAAQVVTSALEAIGTATEIRRHAERSQRSLSSDPRQRPTHLIRIVHTYQIRSTSVILLTIKIAFRQYLDDSCRSLTCSRSAIHFRTRLDKLFKRQ